MYIHYTGYVISSTPFSGKASIPALFYTLSTESSFFFEFLETYWANLTEPLPYSSQASHRPFCMNLMGSRSYYMAVKNLPYPVEIKYAKGFGSFRRYLGIYHSRK